MRQLIKYFEKLGSWGVEIKTCGYHHIAPNAAYPPVGHPKTYTLSWQAGRRLKGFHIVYFPSGNGALELANKKNMTIQAGDVLFLFENDWHRYKPNRKTGWEEYWIGFDGDYFRQFIVPDLFKRKQSFVKSIGYSLEVVQNFESTLLLAKRMPANNKMVCVSLLNLIARLMEASSSNAVTKQPDEVLEHSLKAIQQNVTGRVNFKAMAKDFGMSYSGYRKTFKQKAGMALNQYLIREKLLLAQRMIRNTALSLSAIAEKSGFSSMHYFSRLYKKKFGYSPSKETR